ncbi:DUF6226 family protein [Paeniglutamicibacter sulfureus]|uniref:DUF6226 family protein n=1 Tax=Paeniglutamicibacter sulfureus TaxID=43666 RepID=UPI0026651DDB|nr:DUF6226 family protein [Paeniglutamicibacter sulfureus]MDO2935439.1 DUF6226 family protein [Paeniglutamicibacter sulfureus]
MDTQPPIFDAPARSRPGTRRVPGPGADLAADVELVGIRHYPGWDDFAAYARKHGEEPVRLARDMAALLHFIHDHRRALEPAGGLRLAAEIFLGNAVAQAREDVRWESTTPGQMMVGAFDRYYDPRVMIDAVAQGGDQAVERAAALLEQWLAQVVPKLVPLNPVPRPSEAVPAPYRRPLLEEAVYRDEDDVPINYGRRWADGETPEDSYERISHPERFAGLGQLVRALAAHLESNYQVRREDAQLEDGTRITLVPADPLATPMRLESTTEGGQPTVRVYAGAAHDFVVPSCGCDACDETLQSAGDELENLVLGVAAGGFAERIYDVGGQPWIQFRLTAPDGNSSRGGERSADPNKNLDEARTMLEKVPGGWHPWPLRALS